jgi:hypothetical protein
VILLPQPLNDLRLQAHATAPGVSKLCDFTGDLIFFFFPSVLRIAPRACVARVQH